MLIFNGKEVQLNSPLLDVNVHRLFSQARSGLNVFLATGAGDEAFWVDFLLRVSAQLPTLRLVGLVPPSIYTSLALTHGNIPVLAVPEGLLREAAEARRQEKPLRLHLAWVASSKGGMGKSTFAVLLAHQWSKLGTVKVVEQDATSTLGTVLRSLVESEAGPRLRLQAQGELFLREREPGKPEQIFFCPPLRPNSSSATDSRDLERMVLDALLAAAVLLPGDRLIIDLPGDVGMAVERLEAVATMMEVTGAKLRGLDIYLFVQPQMELMEQAIEAIREPAEPGAAPGYDRVAIQPVGRGGCGWRSKRGAAIGPSPRFLGGSDWWGWWRDLRPEASIRLPVATALLALLPMRGSASR